MYKVAAITGGRNVPSRIFRVHALERYLEKNDIELTEFLPLVSSFPPQQRLLRPFWLFAALMERLTLVWRINGFDVAILQRELISTLPTVEGLIPGDKILDVDDAIYLHRRGIAAKFAATSAIGVVCGNDVLAEKFSQWNINISVIPTGVDTLAIKPKKDRLYHSKRIIGWIGTPGNLKYLEMIADDIIRVLSIVDNAELRVVTSTESAIPNKLKQYTRFVKWYPGVENQEIPTWALGIMPLIDDEWSRGKCSFKLLQYLSGGVPVVASPVGMNKKVMEEASVGYSPILSNEWIDAMVDLLTNDQTNSEYGVNGRRLVEDKYSLSVIARMWKGVLGQWL